MLRGEELLQWGASWKSLNISGGPTQDPLVNRQTHMTKTLPSQNFIVRIITEKLYSNSLCGTTGIARISQNSPQLFPLFNPQILFLNEHVPQRQRINFRELKAGEYQELKDSFIPNDNEQQALLKLTIDSVFILTWEIYFSVKRAQSLETKIKWSLSTVGVELDWW